MKPRLLASASLALVLLVAGSEALAQRPQGRDGGRQMSPEERQRLREDMHSTRRDVYRDGRREHAQPSADRRMSPEERDKLRRDVEDANRGMRRR